MSFDVASPIAYPGTYAPGTAWDLYNQLIAGIPEDVEVRDYCLGLNWSYVEADCGMGVAFTIRCAYISKSSVHLDISSILFDLDWRVFTP